MANLVSDLVGDVVTLILLCSMAICGLAFNIFFVRELTGELQLVQHVMRGVRLFRFTGILAVMMFSADVCSQMST